MFGFEKHEPRLELQSKVDLKNVRNNILVRKEHTEAD